MSVILRTIMPSDREAIYNLLAKIQVFDASDRSVAMELVNTALDCPAQQDYSFIVAMSDRKELEGYACFGPIPLTEGSFELYWIAVNPVFACQGIGSRLLLEIESHIEKNHGRMLLLETSSRAEYEPTRCFYLKNGFRLVERIPDFYRSGEDRLTFRKCFNGFTEQTGGKIPSRFPPFSPMGKG
jgi:ribosomal protein S18 acetylase RimI-like enzyme